MTHTPMGSSKLTKDEICTIISGVSLPKFASKKIERKVIPLETNKDTPRYKLIWYNLFLSAINLLIFRG
jgi:hypothetical protein